MHRNEITERGFSVNANGKVLDNFGNEHRNEYGQCEYEEDTCVWCKKTYYVGETGVEEGFCSEYCKLEEYNNS